MRVPVSDPSRFVAEMRKEIDAAVSRVLSSGRYILGPENEALAHELSEFMACGHTILVANGTQAIEIALEAIGVGTGSQVITVANAGGYSPAAIRKAGGEPCYVDIDPNTLQMSVESLRECLTRMTQAPAAIIVTHLFGKIAPILEICELAKAHGVPVLEDCAQSLGAVHQGRRAGTFGQISTTSFYPTKNLGALGDGGAIFTDNPELADRARSLRQYGWGERYHVELPGGVNSRLDEIQAAILRLGLVRLDRKNEIRRSIHSRYRETVPDLGVFPHEPLEDFTAHLSIVVTEKRENIRSRFNQLGIATDIHYPVPDHLQIAYPKKTSTVLPVTEEMSKKILTIPLFPEMDEEQIELVSYALRN